MPSNPTQIFQGESTKNLKNLYAFSFYNVPIGGDADEDGEDGD